MYEVLWSVGVGLQHGPRFRLYRDALRYVQEHREYASYAIKAPDGVIHEISTRRDR